MTVPTLVTAARATSLSVAIADLAAFAGVAVLALVSAVRAQTLGRLRDRLHRTHRSSSRPRR